LLQAASRWLFNGFRCTPSLTVAELTASLPKAVREDLVEPLCVAALNTPAVSASATVFLRVLKDGLFGGPGSADLLLPRRPLSELLPLPAERWLLDQGAEVHRGTRVQSLQRSAAGWTVDGRGFDAVVLACSAPEAARLAAPLQPAWASCAAALGYEPIVTVYIECPGARLAMPMTALRSGPRAPAQFVFDHGALAQAPGRFAFVVSGAAEWVSRGLEACAEATLAQALDAFPAGTWPSLPRVLRTVAEKRATFACTPGLARPASRIAPGLAAAGDYVEGPYPATLEGAVRSALTAVGALEAG
jgi:predicted NAD/FAD-dependent oxidoreductase